MGGVAASCLERGPGERHWRRSLWAARGHGAGAEPACTRLKVESSRASWDWGPWEQLVPGPFQHVSGLGVFSLYLCCAVNCPCGSPGGGCSVRSLCRWGVECKASPPPQCFPSGGPAAVGDWTLIPPSPIEGNGSWPRSASLCCVDRRDGNTSACAASDHH